MEADNAAVLLWSPVANSSISQNCVYIYVLLSYSRFSSSTNNTCLREKVTLLFSNRISRASLSCISEHPFRQECCNIKPKCWFCRHNEQQTEACPMRRQTEKQNLLWIMNVGNGWARPKACGDVWNVGHLDLTYCRKKKDITAAVLPAPGSYSIRHPHHNNLVCITSNHRALSREKHTERAANWLSDAEKKAERWKERKYLPLLTI